MIVSCNIGLTYGYRFPVIARGGGGQTPVGVLSVVAYTGGLRQKGVPFSGFRYIEGYEFYLSKYMKG